MKQSAVEWYGLQIGILISKFFNNEISKSKVHFKRIEIEEQAKKMDKQQRSYSEEDLKYAFDSGRVRLTFDKKRPFVFKNYEEFIEQFKNK